MAVQINNLSLELMAMSKIAWWALDENKNVIVGQELSMHLNKERMLTSNILLNDLICNESALKLIELLDSNWQGEKELRLKYIGKNDILLDSKTTLKRVFQNGKEIILGVVNFSEQFTEEIDEIVYLYDLVKRCSVYSNEATYKVLGFSKEEYHEFGPDFLTQVVHPDDIPKVFAHHAKVKNGKKGDTYEVVYRAKSKSLDYRWLKSRDKVYRRDVNQNAIELVGVARDITQRVEIENELEQSEMLFKTLTESLTVGVYLVRKDGYLFYANGKCSEIMGLPKSKCLGFEWKNNIHPNDKEWVINGWNNALAQNEIFDAEFNWKHNQVYEVPVKVYMRPLDYNKDNIETFIGTIIDLSAQKKIQHAINNQKQDLEQFAYIASHDLKAPLTNMQGLIEMAKEYIKVDAIGDDLLEKINVSLARMRNTITSLNEVIAVKKNLELPKGTIKIEPELKAVVNDFSEMIKQADGQIDLRVEDDLEIEFPEIHFDRIFQNLISNALKYAEPNRKPAIKIKAKNQDNYVRVDVEDNGMGMDLDKVGSKVFGLYQRFTTKKEGKGIGLHLVQSIIKRYHGKIEVHSKLGVGTRFTIFFKVHN